MGDHDDSLVPGQLLYRLLEPILVFRVHISSRLVQNNNGRILAGRAMRCFLCSLARSAALLPLPGGRLGPTPQYRAALPVQQDSDDVLHL